MRRELALRFVVVVGVVWWWEPVEAACPRLNLMENFNTDKYMGIWYEIQAQPSLFQSVKSCLKSFYTKDGPDSIEVVSKGLDSREEPTQTRSHLIIVDPKKPSHMVTDFVPGVQPPFDILDTDYTTYSCVHSCLEVIGIKSEFLFIYSRNRTLDAKNVDHCRSMFEKYGLDTTPLVNTPQANCHDHTDL